MSHQPGSLGWSRCHRPKQQSRLARCVVTRRAEKTVLWARAKMRYNRGIYHRSCSGTTAMAGLLPGSFGKLIHPFIAVEWEWTRLAELLHVNTKAPQVSWSFEMSLPIAWSSEKTNRLFKIKTKTTFIAIPTKILVNLQPGRLERKGFISFVACCAFAGWTYALKCDSYHLRGRAAEKCAYSLWFLGRLFPLILRPSFWLFCAWPGACQLPTVTCCHVLQFLFST